MPWIQLRLQPRADQVDHFAEQLSELGAVAVSMEDAGDQPIYEPAPGATDLWADTLVCGLFSGECVPNTLIDRLTALNAPQPLPPYRFEELADQQWERAWMDDYKPMRFGERLWICPSHMPPPDPEGINISLDPGLAFGTGTHATTALCLEYLAAHPPENQYVIDFGCGSGILAIAAAKLGAKHIWAVDHDAQAITATIENARVNKVDLKISTCEPEALENGRHDLIAANILAQPLIELCPLFHALLRPGGRFVISGILAEQSADVLTQYRKFFEVEEIQQREAWCCIHGVKPDGESQHRHRSP